MNIRGFLTSLLIAADVWAESGHGSGHIPTNIIFWQCFNLAIVFAILYFAGRKSIQTLFLQRREGFVASAKKADEAKAEAEKKFVTIQHKLDHLKSSYDESMSRAEAEAADLRKQLMSEANEQARRVREEAHSTIKIEMQRAQRDLHEMLVRDSIGLARQVLSKDIGSGDHQKLQSDFTKNIEAVHP